MTAEEKAAKRAEIKLKYQEFMKCYPLDPKSLADEIWADITGYEGLYQISSYGRVKSFHFGKEHILRPAHNEKGYLKVHLVNGTNHKNAYIHIMVARAFIPNPENKPEVNHSDGIKLNCHVSNLEWATSSENNKHAFREGLNRQAKGENHPKAKLTNEQADWCRKVYTPYDSKFGMTALSKKFSVSTSCIDAIVNGNSYREI